MKLTVLSATDLSSGSYMLDRNGDLTRVRIHAPSTTYLGRGITHLSPTDAEFLLSKDRIDEDSAYSIVLMCFIEYLSNELKVTDHYSILDTNSFFRYAELQYCPTLGKLLMSRAPSGSVASLITMLSQYPDFEYLDSTWYPYLLNAYVKVSRYNNDVEFRINSDDGFDWNKAILDHVILNPKYHLKECKFTILRESSKGYRAYFMNATLDDIINKDSTVLTSTVYNRESIDGQITYTSVKEA